MSGPQCTESGYVGVEVKCDIHRSCHMNLPIFHETSALSQDGGGGGSPKTSVVKIFQLGGRVQIEEQNSESNCLMGVSVLCKHTLLLF